MTERFTPSELVYLFVDGEATTQERAEMYAALAGDNDLQAEFEDALRLKQTTNDEVAAVLPPFHATKEIFLKAGFAVPVPIAGGEAIAPVISRLVESGGWLASVKSFILPIIASTGIIVGSVVNMPFFDRIGTRNYQAEAPRTAQEQTSATSTNSSLLNEPLELPTLGMMSRSTNTSATTQSHRTAYNKAVPLQDAERTPAVGVYDESATPIPQENIVENIPSKSSISNAITKEPAGASIEQLVREHNTIRDLRLESDETSGKLWLGGGGIAGLKLYPNRASEGASTVTINNIALSAEYEFSPGERVGVAAGSETFPHYIVENDTNLTQKWNIVWGGATYSIAAYDLALGPLVPVFGTMLGFAGTGPLGKLSAGFAWQPDDRVRFSLACEATGLMYHYGSTNRTAGKLGASYNVTVKF